MLKNVHDELWTTIKSDDYFLCLFSGDAPNVAGDREWSLTLGDLFLKLDQKERILVHA